MGVSDLTAEKDLRAFWSVKSMNVYVFKSLNYK